MGHKKKKKREAEAAAAAAAAAAGAPPPAAGAPPPPAGAPPAPGPPPPPGKRQRGEFGDEPKGAVDSQTDLGPRARTWDDDDAAAIPMIPDLDDVQEEDLALQVAPAPLAPVNRVATMAELNEDLEKKPAFMTLDGLDLQLLAHCLMEAPEVAEPDKPWVWDVIFTEIMSEVQDEQDLEPVSADPTPQPSQTAVDKKSSTRNRAEGSKTKTQAEAQA